MAEYIATTRTNYFHVKDVEIFKEIVSQISEDMEVFTATTKDGDTVYGFGGYGVIHGFGEDGYDEDEVYNALRDHVVTEGEAIVIEEIGAEKLRYLIAYAVIITTEKVEFVDLKEEVEKRLPADFAIEY